MVTQFAHVPTAKMKWLEYKVESIETEATIIMVSNTTLNWVVTSFKDHEICNVSSAVYI